MADDSYTSESQTLIPLTSAQSRHLWQHTALHWLTANELQGSSFTKACIFTFEKTPAFYLEEGSHYNRVRHLSGNDFANPQVVARLTEKTVGQGIRWVEDILRDQVRALDEFRGHRQFTTKSTVKPAVMPSGEHRSVRNWTEAVEDWNLMIHVGDPDTRRQGAPLVTAATVPTRYREGFLVFDLDRVLVIQREPKGDVAMYPRWRLIHHAPLPNPFDSGNPFDSKNPFD